MGAQFLDGVEFALQFLLGEDGVDLRMTGTADAHDLFDRFAVKIAFVALVVMACPGDQMVPGEAFLPVADRASSVHRSEDIGWGGRIRTKIQPPAAEWPAEG